MAEVVDKMPKASGGGCRPKYAWDTWLDGQAWKLTAGEDFEIPLRSFQAAANKAARNRGLEVITRQHDGCLYIQALKK